MEPWAPASPETDRYSQPGKDTHIHITYTDTYTVYGIRYTVYAHTFQIATMIVQQLGSSQARICSQAKLSVQVAGITAVQAGTSNSVLTNEKCTVIRSLSLQSMSQ